MTTSQVTVAARLAAKILAHRQTPQHEVTDLIRYVHGALARLADPPETVTPALVQAPKEKAAAPRRQPRRQPAAPPVAAEPPAPVVPKLVRRADMVGPAATPPALTLTAPPSATLRGVVRWFDPKSGKGAVRLPGLGDVGFEARLLADSGITRLFKGQEIEAALGGNGTPQLQRLTLPGTVTGSPLGGGGTVRSRHAKPVLVELKREALKRAAARAEAELVLGPNRTR